MPCLLEHRKTFHAIFLRATIFFFFFLGGVTATAPSRDLTDNKKKEERGLKQRRKQKEAAQGDPEPKKGNQEKEKKNQVEYRVEGALDRRRRRKPGGWKETPNTRKKGGETHKVAVVETRAASIEAWQKEANTAEEPC